MSFVIPVDLCFRAVIAVITAEEKHEGVEPCYDR
jgi:hypothetical protein